MEGPLPLARVIISHIAPGPWSPFSKHFVVAGPKLYGPSDVTPHPTIAFVGNSHLIMYGAILSKLANEYRTSVGFVAEVNRVAGIQSA